jgi:hypothetical protein
LAAALFLFVIGEVLSALAVIVLAVVAPSYLFVALHLFGAFIALRAATILGYGFAKGVLFIRMRAVLQREQPTKFWLVMGFNLLAVLVGIFLTRLPIK